MNGIKNLCRRAYNGEMSGKQLGLVFLMGYVLFVLLTLLHVGVGSDMPRNGALFYIRLGWGLFGLVSGSALVLMALVLAKGAWKISETYSTRSRLMVRSATVLHVFIVLYASGLLLLWLTLLTIGL